MLIAQFNGRNAEFVDIEIMAVDGAGSFTQNFGACLAVNGNSATGLMAVQPAAINLKSWAGVLRQNIAINGFGLSRVWGYAASAICSNYGSSVTITAGDALRPTEGTGLGFSSTATAITILNTKYGVALSTTANGNSTNGALSASGAWVPMLVRAI